MEKYMRRFASLVVVVLSLAGIAAAQNPTPSAPLSNIYAAGASYSVNATPSIAGTGLYAHLLVPSTSTYAFTVVDVLPNTLKPFTVNTNFGGGITQKLVTLGNVPIYIPTAAGISFNGTNTGWQWNTGALASVHLKGNYYLMPNVRVLKSSVSNGSGYQPVIGVLLGWGK